MAVYDIGPPGHSYQTTMAAYGAAVAAGPDPAPVFELYGPWTETNQSLVFAIPNIKMRAVGGSYVFEGSGTTATWIQTTAGATYCTVEGGGLIQCRGYKSNCLSLTGASGLFSGLDLTQNIPLPGATFYHAYVAGTRCTLEDIDMGVIASVLATVQGVYNTSTGLVLRRISVHDITTDVGFSLYPIVFASTQRGGLLEDFTILNNTSGSNLFGLYIVGDLIPIAGQVGTIRRGEISGNAAVGAHYSISVIRGSWYISNILTLTSDAPTYGLMISGGLPDPTAGNSCIKHCTVYSMSKAAYQIAVSAGHIWDVQNNIASSCESGFYTSIGANIVSGGNDAFACSFPYPAPWPKLVSDTLVDPLFVAPGTNFRLQAASPCIDTGLPAPLIRYDLVGMSRPQVSGYDKGAYEAAAPSTVVVRGTHLTNGGAGISAYFVDVLTELTATPATSVTFVDDALAAYSFLQGTAGVVAAGSDLFLDAAATFWEADIGKYLYIHGAEPENSGFRLITEFVSPTSVRVVNTFIPWVTGVGAGPPPTAGAYVETANPTRVTAVGAPFTAAHVGRTLYTATKTGVANNAGEWIISGWDSPAGTYVTVSNGGVFTDESPIDYAVLPVFVADVNSGSILWSLLPSWSPPILRPLGPLDATNGKLLVLEIPALAAGDYYIKVENPGGEVFTFRETVVTI